MPRREQPEKCCFVTIGATAPFDSLISACLEREFHNILVRAGYTDLILQCGKEGYAIFKLFKESEELATGLDLESTDRALLIHGFTFNKYGLSQEMRTAKGESGGKYGGVEGVVICHAGSGSILDALRINVPLIVVPNPDLLDNHQVELAEELASQGYVIHGKLNDLSAAIIESEELRERQKRWPPVNSGRHRGLAGVMDDEMGFID